MTFLLYLVTTVREQLHNSNQNDKCFNAVLKSPMQVEVAIVCILEYLWMMMHQVLTLLIISFEMELSSFRFFSFIFIC